MIVERVEPWGKLIYDLSKHHFSLIENDGKEIIPYSQRPVVLNVDLTMKCNMDCLHCVTKDFGYIDDLAVSRKLIDWINNSPFLVVVITGGEPFLPEYNSQLLRLLQEIRNKGLIIDTNGTIIPSNYLMEMIRNTNTLIRISWDAVRSFDEIRLRHVKPDTKQNRSLNLEYFHKKVAMIKHFQKAGVDVAIQSVVNKANRDSIFDLPVMLHNLSIKQWYIQRFIPSHKATDEQFEVNTTEYAKINSRLIKRCQDLNIECITKKDRRHNCVVLLVGEGLLYTQGEKPGQKLLLGTINSNIRYFDYISSADHAERYYG
jgi:MoaA/NifB/PqqE/SkfB family radical SAM enzyme